MRKKQAFTGALINFVARIVSSDSILCVYSLPPRAVTDPPLPIRTWRHSGPLDEVQHRLNLSASGCIYIYLMLTVSPLSPRFFPDHLPRQPSSPPPRPPSPHQSEAMRAVTDPRIQFGYSDIKVFLTLLESSHH